MVTTNTLSQHIKRIKRIFCIIFVVDACGYEAGVEYKYKHMCHQKVEYFFIKRNTYLTTFFCLCPAANTFRFSDEKRVLNF